MHVGGAQDNTLLTVERHDRKKFNVTLMCSAEGAWVDRAKSIPDLKIVFVDKLTRPIHPVSDVLAFFQIYRHLKHEKYDIVHTHSSKPGFLGRIAAKLANVPVVVHTIHGFPFHDFMLPVLRRFFIFLEKKCARLSDKLITVSKLNLKKTLDLGIAPKDKLVNIYSGIDFRNFDHKIDGNEIRNALAIPQNSLVVGIIGRLSKQKSPWNLVKAAPLVLKKHPNTIFVSVGNGELQKEMYALAEKLKLGKQFKFLGFREDIANLLHIFDVYTLPSQWEGLGRSLTEAMYMKKAVIASAVEGVPELVEHGKTGLLVPPNDPEKLAESICQLLGDTLLRNNLGKKAHFKVKDIFEADKMVVDIEKLYFECLIGKKTIAGNRVNGKATIVNAKKEFMPSSEQTMSQ